MDDTDASRPPAGGPARFRRILHAVTGSGRPDAPPPPGRPGAAPDPRPAAGTPSVAPAPTPPPPATPPPVDTLPARISPPPDTDLALAVAARAAAAAQREADRRWREFCNLVEETYPSVAPDVEALASEPPLDRIDEWLTVARLLSDDRHHRSGGLSAEARERALRAAVSQALEAQARSSARIAGFHETELDNLWDPDPAWVGQTVWEHYLCREAILVRESLHGEALGEWLGSLGELWSAADDLLAQTEDVQTVRVLDVRVVDRDPPAGSIDDGPASDFADTFVDDVEIEIIDAEIPFRADSEIIEIETYPSTDAPTTPAVAVDGAAAHASSALGSGVEPPSSTESLDAARARLRAALKVVEELALW